MLFCLHFATCFYLCFFPLSVPLSFTLHFTHLPFLTTQLSFWSSIHLPTPFSPEQSNLSLLLYSTEGFLSTFLFFSPLLQIFHILLHQSFHCNISLSFTSLPTPSSLFFISFPLSCHLTFLPIIPLSNPELSYLAAVTAAAVARPQTSASPVPQHLYSADQTNRFNSPKLAVLTAALMCSWPACAKSQLNMLQTHVAYTQYH